MVGTQNGVWKTTGYVGTAIFRINIWEHVPTACVELCWSSISYNDRRGNLSRHSHNQSDTHQYIEYARMFTHIPFMNTYQPDMRMISQP